MDKNQGYSIMKTIMLDNHRGFALWHHPTTPSPYVTWACYDDKNGQRHTDKSHLHNHIYFNSTAFDRSRKFHNFIGSSFALRRITDQEYVEHDLSVI